MKKLRVLCLLLALLMVVAVPVSAETEMLENGCVSLQAQKPLDGSEKKLDTAKAAILYELDSKTLVYAYQPDLRIDPSGMNKIMTALLALENADPEAVAVVSRKALDSVKVGSVSANLKRYEEMRIIDLLYCMMVKSANDAAAVIAEFVGGSQETFVAMMNQRALELGCKNTNFVNATGINAEGQYSTARDLAIITEAALQNETFVKLFSTVKYTVEKTNMSDPRELETSNNMMRPNIVDHYDSRVTGGKTGASTTTERSLICTAQEDGSRYLSVVMCATGSVTDDPNIVDKFGSYEETDALLDYGFGRFSVFNLMLKEHAVAQFSVVNGENQVSVCPDQAVRISLPKYALLEDVTYRCVEYAQIEAPVKMGQKLGYVEAWYDGLCVAKYDLFAMHDVQSVDEAIKALPLTYTEPQVEEIVQDITAWIIVAVLLAAAVLLVIVLIKRIRKSIERKRIRKALEGSSK